MLTNSLFLSNTYKHNLFVGTQVHTDILIPIGKHAHKLTKSQQHTPTHTQTRYNLSISLFFLYVYLFLSQAHKHLHTKTTSMSLIKRTPMLCVCSAKSQTHKDFFLTLMNSFKNNHKILLTTFLITFNLSMGPFCQKWEFLFLLQLVLFILSYFFFLIFSFILISIFPFPSVFFFMHSSSNVLSLPMLPFHILHQDLFLTTGPFRVLLCVLSLSISFSFIIFPFPFLTSPFLFISSRSFLLSPFTIKFMKLTLI